MKPARSETFIEANITDLISATSDLENRSMMADNIFLATCLFPRKFGAHIQDSSKHRR